MVVAGASAAHAFWSEGTDIGHAEVAIPLGPAARRGRRIATEALRAFQDRLVAADRLDWIHTDATRTCAPNALAAGDSDCRPVAVHTLPHPLDGSPLWRRVAVAEKIDRFPAAEERAAPPAGARRALLLTDEFSTDIADTARLVGTEAASVLREAGYEVDRRGRFESEDQFARSLEDRALFVFFGHADRGPGGSGLRLGPRGVRVSGLDLLEHVRTAPHLVFLLGCSTSEGESVATGLELGPAQAFLMLGSGAVVATRRPVRERDAAAFAACLLAAAGDAVARFSSALAACRHLGSALDDFRILVP